MANEPVLRPEEVASVLSGEEDPRPAAIEDSKQPEGSRTYSLRRPSVIAPADEPIARQRIERLAGGLAGVLERALDAQIGFDVQGFQQEQAGAAVDTLPKPAWILCFLREGGGGLALALDPTCALALVEVALGGAGNTTAGGREPTPLETRVLTNLCSTLAEPLAAQWEIKLARCLFRMGRLPEGLATPGETLGIGLLKIRIAELERSGLLLSTPGLLKPSSDSQRRSSEPRVGPLAARLARCGVEVRPVLTAGLVGLADLVELEPGTVLGLEPEESAPLELRVAGTRLFTGRIVRSEEGPGFRVGWRRGARPAGPVEPEQGKDKS